MQHSGKWNTTSQILKPKNIKLRDINGLTSSQIKKMWDRCRSQDTRERFYICIQIVFVIVQVVIKP